MKKIALIMALLGVLLIPSLSYAQATTTTYSNLTKQEQLLLIEQLKTRIAELMKLLIEQLTAEANAKNASVIPAYIETAKPPVTQPAVVTPKPEPVVYSDYNFAYKYDANRGVLTYPITSRDLELTKAVFKVSANESEDDTVGFINGYPLEKKDGNTFIYVGNPIRLTQPTNKEISVVIQRSKNRKVSVIFPQMEEWEIWDKTTNKPVKISCGYLWGCHFEE